MQILTEDGDVVEEWISLIHCTPIASIYYNPGNGYTVAFY